MASAVRVACKVRRGCLSGSLQPAQKGTGITSFDMPLSQLTRLMVLCCVDMLGSKVCKRCNRTKAGLEFTTTTEFKLLVSLCARGRWHESDVF